MAVPILLPIIGYSVLSVLISYVAIRLYRSRGAYSDVLPNPVSSFKFPVGRPTWWDFRKSLTWTWPTGRKKAKPSKNMTVDLLPITGLPPPPTALPITPPLVDISSVSIPRTPSPSFHQHINKQIHSLHSTSFPRPPSPHALLATTSPQKHPRRSRSLGGVPVRRLSGGASGLRNVQFLDREIEMQKMDRSTSREHLLIDFSSSGSSDELDVLRRGEEEEEEVVLSRRVSPASSDIGVLPSHRRPSLFDDAEVPLVDLAPGGKVLPLVDLGDVEDSLGVKKKEEDMWKWFVPPASGKIHLTPLESTPVSMVKPISKSISEPLPTTSLPLAMSEGILIDFHSEPDQEHVLVDLNVQDDINVPQQGHHEFVHVHTTHVDLDATVNISPTRTAVSLDDPPVIRSTLDARRSLDSLMKPITSVGIITPDPILVEISTSSVEESSQRGRRVDRHPLEEAHEVEVKAVPEKAEASPATVEDEKQDLEELVNEDELYDHHNDNYAFDKHRDYHSPQSFDAIRASSSSPQVATIPVQAAPAWYWDHEDDPWNGAVTVVNEEGGRDVEEELVGETEETEEHRGKVEEGDEERVNLMEADLEVGEDEDEDVVKTTPSSKALELPVERSLEEVPTETEDEQSYPDPDYLPLPELLLGPSSPAVATETRLVLVEDGPPNNFQENEENQNDQDEVLQQSKDDEKIPRRAAAQMPTPPASPPPTSALRVKSLGGEPTSPNSLSLMGGLLPLASVSPLSTPQSIPLKLGPSLVLTPPNTAPLSSPTIGIKMKVPEEDKENARVDKENESPNSATGRPLWSIRADDAPSLGLAASSLSSSGGLKPGAGTNMGGSPRTMRRVLGDVTAVVENGEREEKVKEDTLKDEKDEEDEESSLPGAFPEFVKSINSSDTDIIVAPTITIAALTSTLLTTSIAAASSSISSTTSTSTSTSTLTSSTTALETSPPLIKRRPIVRSPLDIALAMQLRPGLGAGADPAWMVRFLMAMFGWFAILVSGQGEF